ncbi:MAG: hypothetical protein R2792_07795 [Saprospiraceae bacterium]
MHKLSSIAAFFLLAYSCLAQSPHGELLRLDCGACHNAANWEIPKSYWAELEEQLASDNPDVQQLNLKFNHNNTLFPLTGQHALAECRDCHEGLIFEEAEATCYSCHTDIHQQTVGMDCTRCHSQNNWLVDDINEIHQINGFPLLGQHAFAYCTDCHQSETRLRFDRLGNECLDCHQMDYQNTSSPNHSQAGYSTNCMECHDVAASAWSGLGGFGHFFFPLEKGHEIADCSACHTGGTFSNLSPECFSCHQTDYESALTPNHQALNFSTDCTACHTTDVGWMPAKFGDHDNEAFPIYSGNHKNEWNACTDCHTDPGNYTVFSCIDCHEHNNPSRLANEHDDVGGYQYVSSSCYACHPDGSE